MDDQDEEVHQGPDRGSRVWQ